jgi:hypothetical protein
VHPCSSVVKNQPPLLRSRSDSCSFVSIRGSALELVARAKI